MSISTLFTAGWLARSYWFKASDVPATAENPKRGESSITFTPSSLFELAFKFGTFPFRRSDFISSNFEKLTDSKPWFIWVVEDFSNKAALSTTACFHWIRRRVSSTLDNNLSTKFGSLASEFDSTWGIIACSFPLAGWFISVALLLSLRRLVVTSAP